MINNSHNSIETIRVKNKWLDRVMIFVILILLSALFSYMTYILTVGQFKFIKKSRRSEGVIVSFLKSKSSKGSTMYSPIVQYADKQGNNQLFSSSLSSSLTSYKIGQKVDILVPNDGDVPQISSFMDLWFGGIIVSIFTLISLLALFLTTYATIRNWRMHKLLSREGTVIQAKILSVNESTHYKNKSLSWIIQAQWLNPQNNKVYTFESEDIMYNPKDFIGDTIEVTVLAQDPKVYEMNISSLPVAAN